MAAIQPTGSSPPSGSPSFSSPTRWNNRTVDIVCGILTLVALYVIWKFTQSSTQEPPNRKLIPEDPFLTNQHTIGFDGTTICFNESPPLPFEKFAEGVICFNMKKSDDVYTFENELQLFLPGRTNPFFVRKIGNFETIFVPNLPYLQNVILSINNKHFQQFDAIYERGLYTLSFNDKISSAMTFQKLQESSALSINPCSPPLPLDVQGITVTFKADGTISTAQVEEDKGFVMENQGTTCIVYLQISIPEQYRTAENQNIVLTWVLEAKQKEAINFFRLKDKWEEAYKGATGKYVSLDASLQLQAIAYRTYADVVPPPTT